MPFGLSGLSSGQKRRNMLESNSERWNPLDALSRFELQTLLGNNKATWLMVVFLAISVQAATIFAKFFLLGNSSSSGYTDHMPARCIEPMKGGRKVWGAYVQVLSSIIKSFTLSAACNFPRRP